MKVATYREKVSQIDQVHLAPHNQVAAEGDDQHLDRMHMKNSMPRLIDGPWRL